MAAAPGSLVACGRPRSRRRVAIMGEFAEPKPHAAFAALGHLLPRRRQLRRCRRRPGASRAQLVARARRRRHAVDRRRREPRALRAGTRRRVARHRPRRRPRARAGPTLAPEPSRRRRDRGLRLRAARRVARAMRRRRAAGVDRARVPVRGALDRRRARAAVAASDASAHALVLVPGIHGRRPAACCASAGSPRRGMPAQRDPMPAGRRGRRSGSRRRPTMRSP